MKSEELKKIAKKNGYEFSYDEASVYLEKICTEHKTNIEINRVCVDRLWFGNFNHCDDSDMNMVEAAVKYAKTPLEEREKEKKFYLRHKWIRWNNGGLKYLNKLLNRDNIYFLDSKDDFFDVQVQFTQKEINAIKKWFDTDLKDFEQIEVEE